MRSEKRPANRTGFPKGTDPRNGNLRQASLYVVFCRSVLGMSKPLLVSWYVLLGYYVLGYGSYVSLLVPLLYCRFLGAGVDVEASRITCAVSASPSFTSLRRHFSFLLRHRQLWSTCLFLVFSLSPMRKWRMGSSRPEKRPESHQDRKSLSRAVKHCWCDASRCQASTEHAASWAVLSSDTVDGPYRICGFASTGPSMVRLEGHPLSYRFLRMGSQ